MQIRSFRAGPVLALSALLTIGVCGSSMAQEYKLFGIKLLTNSYKDVLRRYGKPDEIQAGGPSLPVEGIPQGAQQNSAQGGFTPGGKGGGGGRLPAGGGPPASSGGGAPPQYAQYARQGAPGGGGAPSSSGGGGGLPGFGGKQSDGDGGGSQRAGGGTANAQDSSEESREVTWWYHDLPNGLHKSFLFNKDGRVIQIQEYGHDQKRKGDRTRKGVGLGSNLNSVLKQYGWSSDGTRSGDNLVMKYGNQYRVAFQLVKNNVIGITIAAGDTRPSSENR